MLTNVATALFGLADMWVIGRLGDAPMQGAVELGAKFMVGLFTIFNFLRTGTVALTAQAAGRGDAGEQATALARAFGASLLIAALILLVKPFATELGLRLLEAEGEVAHHARTYIAIRYWAGAAFLVNYVLIGWLIGQRRVKTVLMIEVAANVVHIALDWVLVLHVGWGVAGVAGASAVSEVLKFIALAFAIGLIPHARLALARFREKATWRIEALRPIFALNRDLFLRTVLLTSAILIFARAGAQQGAVTLAANGILFQLFMLSTLLLDGFESAAQVLCGEAKGARDRALFGSYVKLNLLWGVVVGVVLLAAYALIGGDFAATFSTDPQVTATAREYMPWVVILPVVGVCSFVLDGIYVGAGWTRGMLVTMIVAMVFFVAMLVIPSPLTNTQLWLTWTLFFVVRAGGMFVLLPRLVRRDFGE
ncbi:MAG: MATE family efflux transporter [Xanthobacteraceae bacterium]